MEELEEFFEIGKEIICYESSQDLTEKITYFLKHDVERDRVRKAGRERCLRDHTWHKRFETVFQQMGLI
jgi:spore maturation protein CgeB